MKLLRFAPVFAGLLIPTVLIGCTTQVKYQEEPVHYSLNPPSISVPYLALAFPSGNPQELALQLALVKHKNQAAEEERWLLLHHVPYQWLLVDWQGDQLYLLAVGPYKIGSQLSTSRKKIQQGLSKQDPIPAVATFISEDIKRINRAVAKREVIVELPSDTQPSIQLNYKPSK